MRRDFLRILFIYIFIPLFFLSAASFAQKIQVIKDQDYFPLVNKLIKEAKSSIRVIAFEMGYYPQYPLSPSNVLIQNLINAEKTGVDVKVILEVSNWNDRITKKNKFAGKILSEGGVEVRYDSPLVTTHAKLVIIDSSFAILGSTNWTYYSLTQNKELSLFVELPSAVSELEDYFNRLWEESTSSY